MDKDRTTLEDMIEKMTREKVEVISTFPSVQTKVQRSIRAFVECM